MKINRPNNNKGTKSVFHAALSSNNFPINASKRIVIIKLAKTLKIKITSPKSMPLFLMQFINTLSKDKAVMLKPIIEIIDVF